MSDNNNSGFRVDPNNCLSCGNCVSSCPVGAVSMDSNGASIDTSLCIECRACMDSCPAGAIEDR